VGLIGPPGTGKTLLARSFTSILPPLSRQHALEVASIHSIANTHRPIQARPPFRNPHHSASHVAIIGGGAHPKPGEITLAHRGVLFLDEFPEFDNRVIQSLRQPLEDRIVHIARAREKASFPADTCLMIAMNPCPCGNFGALHKTCTCTPHKRAQYRAKLSGPIIDRIDIWLTVEHIDYDTLMDTSSSEPQSPKMQQQVTKAHQTQFNRKSLFNGQHILNSNLGAAQTSAIRLNPKTKSLLDVSAKKLALSPRAYHRTLRVARTIADVDSDTYIEDKHILEALSYRPKFSY